jgi:hypothetical protein
VQQAKDVGACAVIPKPFSYNEIQSFVDNVELHSAS